jgi:hypothetical protein
MKMHLACTSDVVPASLAIARVHQHPVDPWVETIRVSKSMDVAPGGDERLLGGILGRGIVVEDQAGDRQESTDRDARQLTERVVIAVHRPFHEYPVHRASGGLRDLVGRATG